MDHHLENHIQPFLADISENTKDILRLMARNTTYDISTNLTKRGTYNEIDQTDQLRVQLHSYYNIFADSSSIDRPVVTVPYVDFSSLGLIVSLCLPVHSQNELQGVTCIDAKIEDIFFSVTYYNQGIDTYMFIIDSWGRAIMHPSLPKPKARHDNPVFIDIASLEKGDAAAEIIASMKRGESGQKSLYTGKQDYTIGESYHSVVLHYFWTKVNNSDYSLCIVFTDKDVEIEMALRHNEQEVNYLHPNALIEGEKSRCQHLGAAATKEASMVSFSGAAYRFLSEDILPGNHRQKSRYNYFFKDNAADQAPEFKKTTRSWVTLTGRVDAIWKSKSSSSFNPIIQWLHLVTPSGIIRIFPGTVYENYDPSTYSWYKMATLNQGDVLVQPVRREQICVMISQSIFKGRLNQRHRETDVPVAVVGGELKVTYLYQLLEQLYPACRGARCFIVGESGDVFAHRSYTDKERRTSHLITMEPTIARYLREEGHLIHKQCIDMEKYRVLSSWVLSPKEWVIQAHSPRFELHSVPGTNILVGITWERDKYRKLCNCENLTLCRWEEEDSCQCPCYKPLKFNFCNNTFGETLSRELKFSPICSIHKEKFDIIKRPPMAEEVSALRPCFVTACEKAAIRSECTFQSGCSWCRLEQDSKDMEEEACHDTGQCQAAVQVSYNKTALGVSVFIILIVIAAICIVCAGRRKCPGLLPEYWSRVQGLCCKCCRCHKAKQTTDDTSRLDGQKGKSISLQPVDNHGFSAGESIYHHVGAEGGTTSQPDPTSQVTSRQRLPLSPKKGRVPPIPTFPPGHPLAQNKPPIKISQQDPSHPNSSSSRGACTPEPESENTYVNHMAEGAKPDSSALDLSLPTLVARNGAHGGGGGRNANLQGPPGSDYPRSGCYMSELPPAAPPELSSIDSGMCSQSKKARQSQTFPKHL